MHITLNVVGKLPSNKNIYIVILLPKMPIKFQFEWPIDHWKCNIWNLLLLIFSLWTFFNILYKQGWNPYYSTCWFLGRSEKIKCQQTQIYDNVTNPNLCLDDCAKCSSHLKYIHPTPAVRLAFSNHTSPECCTNLIAIRLDSIAQWWRKYIMVFFCLSSIPNETL